MKEKLVYKNRENSNCEKWDGLQNEYGRLDLLPVWVADMDFEAPLCVKNALQKAVDYNVYGYYCLPDSFYNSIIAWERDCQDYEIQREWIRFIPGVVPAIYWLVQMWSQEDESILVMPPVYYPFMNSIKETGRRLVKCPLRKDNQNHYSMDLELFEILIKQEQVKVFILCSPHNPVGRVWTKEELTVVLDICKKYNVYVIADEIHQDIIMSGYEKVTAATCGSYDNIMITLTSASKSFNLAGFQFAYAIIPDEELRSKYDQMAKKLHFTESNNFAYIATEAAYSGGRDWLESLCELVEGNYQYLKDELSEVLTGATIAPLEGTYLAWVDISNYVAAADVQDVILDKCHLAVDFGEWFGGPEYAQFIRINLATSRDNIREVVNRLKMISKI